MARGLDNYVDPGTNYHKGRSYAPLSKIPKEKLDDYFIFTFIRDPITKMESGISEARKYNGTLTNTEFLLHLDDGCGMNYHTFSQAKYFKQTNPYTGKDLGYDFVGSLETFDEDFAFLRRILLLPPSERRKMVKYSLTVYDPQFHYINSIYGAPNMNPFPKV